MKWGFPKALMAPPYSGWSLNFCQFFFWEAVVIMPRTSTETRISSWELQTWLFDFGRIGIDELQQTPPKKCRKWGILNFFHMFFAISFHVRSNTYSKVIILYPKGNSMLLNTFLTLFWWKNHFWLLWATRYENCSLKIHQKTPQIWCVFWWFFSEQFLYLVA